MDAQNIINSLNTVSQKLFKSLDDEILYGVAFEFFENSLIEY